MKKGEEEDTRVIHSTREIRRKIPAVQCAIDDDQKCHIVGLNLMKEVLNYYSSHALRVSQEEMDQLIKDVNHKDNIRCCSVEANAKDKDVEREILDMLIEGTNEFSLLSPAAVEMFDALQVLLEKMTKHMPDGKSPLFSCLLEHVRKRHFPLPLFCFACCNLATWCEMDSTRIFCNVVCQRSIILSSATILERSSSSSSKHEYTVEIDDSMIGVVIPIMELPSLKITYLGHIDTRCIDAIIHRRKCLSRGEVLLKLLVNNQVVTLYDQYKNEEDEGRNPFKTTTLVDGYIFEGVRWYMNKKPDERTFFTFSIVKA